MSFAGLGQGTLVLYISVNCPYFSLYYSTCYWLVNGEKVLSVYLFEKAKSNTSNKYLLLVYLSSEPFPLFIIVWKTFLPMILANSALPPWYAGRPCEYWETDCEA